MRVSRKLSRKCPPSGCGLSSSSWITSVADSIDMVGPGETWGIFSRICCLSWRVDPSPPSRPRQYSILVSRSRLFANQTRASERVNIIEGGMTIMRWTFLLLALLPLSATAPAQAQTEWIAAVRGGGHVIVFRHGATHQDQADTDPLNFDNVAKQRQLTDAGRAKAKEIGEAFRKLAIPVGPVHTSMFFRAIETGKLAFGDALPPADVTEGGLVVTPIENNRRAAALRKLAGTVPPAGRNAVVVT